jgi:hypothetical protein
MNASDQAALDKIREGFQNVIPRIVQEGNTVKITQGTETITLPIVQSVVSSTIMK